MDVTDTSKNERK